nr:MAG TPA: hypothetical protein [Caudoviricetes sp.]
MDREQLPEEYADVYKTVLEFMGEAENGKDLSLMEDLMTTMIADAKTTIVMRLNGAERARKIIEEWDARHEEHQELAQPENPVEETGKPMKVVPEDQLPDKVLLMNMDNAGVPKRRRGRPPKHPPMM